MQSEDSDSQRHHNLVLRMSHAGPMASWETTTVTWVESVQGKPSHRGVTELGRFWEVRGCP